MVKNPPVKQVTHETKVQSLGQEDPLEEGKATHCDILAWKIPWTEEPGGLHFIRSQRVGHSWAYTAAETQSDTAIRIKTKESERLWLKSRKYTIKKISSSLWIFIFFFKRMVLKDKIYVEPLRAWYVLHLHILAIFIHMLSNGQQMPA